MPFRGCQALLEVRQSQGARNVPVRTVGDAGTNGRLDRVRFARVGEGVQATHYNVSAVLSMGDRFCPCQGAAPLHASGPIRQAEGLVNARPG